MQRELSSVGSVGAINRLWDKWPELRLTSPKDGSLQANASGHDWNELRGTTRKAEQATCANQGQTATRGRACVHPNCTGSRVGRNCPSTAKPEAPACGNLQVEKNEPFHRPGTKPETFQIGGHDAVALRSPSVTVIRRRVRPARR